MYYYVSSSSSLFVQHYILTKTQRQREVYCKLTKHTRRCRRVHFKANYTSYYTMHLILFRLKDFGISWHIDIRSILGVNILNLAQIQTSQFRRTSIYQASLPPFCNKTDTRMEGVESSLLPKKEIAEGKILPLFFPVFIFWTFGPFCWQVHKENKKIVTSKM